MGVLIMIAQMIAALTILVTIHEFGHYITAKWFGVQVDKFFVFFDAPLGRGKRKEGETKEEYQKRGWDGKLWKTKKGETEYGIGWLPLGGYVKLGGMIDESMDKDWEEIPREKQFRFKPAWQKLIIMLAGIFLNLVLGCLIYFGLNATNKKFLPLDKINDKMVVTAYGKKLGFQEGDKPIGANGKEMLRWNDIRKAVGFGGDLMVDRNGKTVSIAVPDSTFTSQNDVFDFQSKIAIGSVDEGGNAAKSGLEKMDIIEKINGKPIVSESAVMNAIQDNKGNTVTMQINRDGQTINKTVAVTNEGKIGIGFGAYERIEDVYSPFYSQMNTGQALKYGVKDAFDMIFLNAKAFGQMGKGKIKPQDSLAGPGQIAMMFGAEWNWVRFWTLTGTLSMILAFMNILPIPALDGGHAVFAIIEMITGKPVNEKVLEIAQIIGFFLIMALMVFILGNDIVKIGSKILGN